MPEYIEREIFINNELIPLVKQLDLCHPKQKKGVLMAIQKLNKTPIADVVEVVRCENCKHLTIHNSPTLYAYCEKTHYRFEPFETDTRTHFCGFGELKEREGE